MEPTRPAQMPPSIPPAWVASLEGTVIAGKYEITRLIGRGGMGTVWAGRHLALDQNVAIKLIHPNRAQSAEAQRRLLVEAKAAAKLRSPNVVTVYDFGVTEEGQPYIVMEYLDGISLDRAIEMRGGLAAREVAHIVMGAAQALEVAHAAGVVHRDLKPDNIFLAKAPEGAPSDFGYVVKLVDFGIAKLVHEEAKQGAGTTQDGMVIGTPHFMSPEALTGSGPVGTEADLWSLGACAFAAMTGSLPFEGNGIGEVAVKVCAAPLPVPSKLRADVPVGFDAWFARACNRDPSKRFATASELASALASVCGLGPVRLATLPEDQIRYELRPAQGSVADLVIPEQKLPTRIAMGAGIVFGIAVTIGLLGAFVWKQKEDADRALLAAASVAAASPRTAPAQSSAPAATKPADAGSDAAPDAARPAGAPPRRR